MWLLTLIPQLFSFANQWVRTRGDIQIVERKQDSTDRQTAASVVKEGMQHKAFWIPWSMAAIPTAGWYGWGMMDSMLYDGTLLPDVSALPPQLMHYADMVMNNLFYSGAGVAGLQVLGKAIVKRK